MMTAAIIIKVSVVCLILGIGVGWKVAMGFSQKKSLSLIEEQSRALEEAKADVEIVRALREGELGIDDLHEIGFEKVQQESTGLDPKPKLTVGDSISSTSQLADAAQYKYQYQPFQRLPYRRAIKDLHNITPGDEVWIPTNQIMHDRDGTVTLMNRTTCRSQRSESHRCRLRMLPNGLLELAVDPDDPNLASGVVSKGDVKIKYLTCLRPVDRYRRFQD